MATIREALPGQRVLVLGAYGFIGTNLGGAPLANGCIVLKPDIAPPRGSGHRSIWRQTDIRDPDALSHVLGPSCPELAIHLRRRQPWKIAPPWIITRPTSTQGVKRTVAWPNEVHTLGPANHGLDGSGA